MYLFQLVLLDGSKRDGGAVQYCGAEMQLQHEELWVGRLTLCFLSDLTSLSSTSCNGISCDSYSSPFKIFYDNKPRIFSSRIII